MKSRLGTFLTSNLFLAGFTLLLFLAAAGVVALVSRTGDRQIALAEQSLENEAAAHFQTLVTMRAWNASHGGVFVKQHDGLQPNPYLQENTLLDKNGNTLIKINPAWMTRQISEMTDREQHLQFRILSRRPLNPANGPRTPFEKEALDWLEHHPGESYYGRLESDRYLLMGRLTVQKSCLSCHGEQGYKVGDLRGGILVSHPIEDYREKVEEVYVNRPRVITAILVAAAVSWLFFFLFIRTLRKHQQTIESSNRNLEERIDLKTRELAGITDSMGDGLYVLDPAGRLTYMNPAAERLLGYGSSELEGREIHNVIHPTNAEGHRVPAEKCPVLLGLEDGDIFTSDREVFTARNGTVIPVQLTSTPILIDGKIRGTVTVFQDIRERKRQEASLEELNRSLREQVEKEVAVRREKEQLLIQQSKLAAMGEMMGAIGHQWRQPLNAIALQIQDLRDAYDYGELDREYLIDTIGKTMAQVTFMSDTIDDFRNFFKPSKTPQPFSLLTAVQEILKVIFQQLRNNTIRLTVECQCGEEHYRFENDIDFTVDCRDFKVHGYPNEFKHAVLNIVNNAKDAILEQVEEGRLKSGGGSILLRLRAEEGKKVLEITDNGGGIPPAFLSRIFEPYFTTKSDDKGTGLGLYMTKTIVEKNMGGTLEVVVADGTTTFTLTLPA